MYGMLYLSGVRSKADFAAASALWFPLNPVWLGIQQKTIYLFDVECSLQSSLIISGCSSFLLFNDNRTGSESENMMNFLCFSFEIMLRAKSIAQTSAVKNRTTLEELLFLLFCLRLLHMLFYCNLWIHLYIYIDSQDAIGGYFDVFLGRWRDVSLFYGVDSVEG